MTRAFIIIEESKLPNARALAKAPPFELPEEAALAQFKPKVSPTGKGASTHRLAAGLFSDEAMAKLNEIAAQVNWAEVHVYSLETEPNKPFEILAARGLKRIHPDLPL